MSHIVCMCSLKLFDMTTSAAKSRPATTLCRHSAAGIQPALLPYTQLCTVDKCTNCTMTECGKSNVVEVQSVDEINLLPTSVDVTTDISFSITESGGSVPAPVPSQYDVRHTCSSSSSSCDEKWKKTKSKSTRGKNSRVVPQRQGVLSDNVDRDMASSVAAVTISGHTQPITSCQLVGDSLIMTSSLDSTIKLWTRAGKELESLDCSSLVRKAVCVPDNSTDDGNQFLILAGTESGHLVVWCITLSTVGGEGAIIERKTGPRLLSLHVPNPVTAMEVSTDQGYLVTGCCYAAFGFVRSKSTFNNCRSSCSMDRRTCGNVKTWNAQSMRASKSDSTAMCSRTAQQLTSSMTSERVGGYGVTCLALCDNSSLLAVGLTSITPASSSSSSAAAAVVVVCNRENLETLWIADGLESTVIHDAVFHCQLSRKSLFIVTNTNVEMLQVTEENPQHITGLTLCPSLCSKFHRHHC